MNDILPYRKRNGSDPSAALIARLGGGNDPSSHWRACRLGLHPRSAQYGRACRKQILITHSHGVAHPVRELRRGENLIVGEVRDARQHVRVAAAQCKAGSRHAPFLRQLLDDPVEVGLE